MGLIGRILLVVYFTAGFGLLGAWNARRENLGAAACTGCGL
jgi:hypothetical protein